MNIELSIRDKGNVILTPVRKMSENGKILFDLVDQANNVLIELELEDKNLIVKSGNELILNEPEIVTAKLDDLYLEVIEAEKSGADSYFENNDTELNPYDPEKIKVRSDKIPITLIAQMIDNNDIDLNPDFQRHLVWNSHQKSRLIESILLRIPLPMFYFAEDKEGKLSVVDGLQRISTIKEFMANKFALKDLQYLDKTCGGRYYESKGKKVGLDSKYLRWFNLTNLSANIIDPSSPFKVKYDIFRRINTGGKPLNNQEIRNCLTGQGLRESLKDMVKLTPFLSATDYSVKSTRMDDEELALRFLAFYKIFDEEGNINSYTGYMDSFLDEFTEGHIKTSKDDFKHYIIAFSNAMTNAEYLLGRKYAFRKTLLKDLEPGAYKQLINKALFVCISILLAKYEPASLKSLNAQSSLLQPLSSEINSDSNLLYYLSYGTNGRANLLYTFDKLDDLFKKHIKHKS